MRLKPILYTLVLSALAVVPAAAQTALRVGSTPTGVPFTFLDTKTNTIQGIMVDLITAVGKDAGFAVTIEPIQFSSLIPALTGDKIDAIAAAMYATPARAQVVDFSGTVITYGEEYGGGRIGEGTEKAGLEQPLHYWVPSIAPSGMTFYLDDAIPGWQNNLLVGSLRFGQLVRLELDGEKVSHEERIMIGQRIRDVRQGPDGAVYLLTDQADGQLLRLRAASN